MQQTSQINQKRQENHSEAKDSIKLSFFCRLIRLNSLVMTKNLHLIVEQPYDRKDYNVVTESTENSLGETVKHLYIEGPFTEADSRNRNRRIYPLDEMVQQINEFNENYVLQGRATGELEHPEYPNLNAKNACHLIKSLVQDGKIFVGKSRIITEVPLGQTVAGLIEAGVQLGISSRSLGSVNEHGIVEDFKLCTFDIVSDPSCPKAWVDGILESKTFSCNFNSDNERVYEEFEKNVKKVSSAQMQDVLYESIKTFFDSLKNNPQA